MHGEEQVDGLDRRCAARTPNRRQPGSCSVCTCASSRPAPEAFEGQRIVICWCHHIQEQRVTQRVSLLGQHTLQMPHLNRAGNSWLGGRRTE